MTAADNITVERGIAGGDAAAYGRERRRRRSDVAAVLAVGRTQNPHSAGLSARVVPGGATDRDACAGEPVAAR